MSWYKTAQLNNNIIEKYKSLIQEFLQIPQVKEWKYEEALTDKNRAVGACASISQDLVEFLQNKGIECNILECTGFIPQLPEDAHKEWKEFVGKDYEMQKYLWHAVVETEDSILDLTGGQYGSVFSGIQIKPKEEFLKNWRNYKSKAHKGKY